MENACRISEQRFRRVFEHTNDAMFLIDVAEDAILDANPKACRMLGYEREELLSLPISVIHPHEMDKMEAFAGSVMDSGSGFTDQLTCFTKQGTYLTAEISAALIDMDGRMAMIASVRDVSERDRLAEQNAYLHDELRSELWYGTIVGESDGMLKVLKQIEMVAPTDSGVLILGESGTGKELVARAIHEASSRRERPLVRVNCASIPSELFESEFFGHVKGAYTGAIRDRMGRFEMADGGTLFLDEVGEIPVELQGKLLRVLQEGTFERVGEDHTRKADVRILAATNRNLETEIGAGRFRQDLYYRLSVFPVEIPPLRDRREDIAPIVEHYVHMACERMGIPVMHPGPEALRELVDSDWPGNVRELQNVVERALILSRGGKFRLPTELVAPARPGVASAATPVEEDTLSLDDLARMERDLIVRALDRSGGKVYGKDGAAEALGLKPTTLASRMKKMGIAKG
ncbi:MAG: sigma-54 interaction domain-containing protein [Planctomycetota bacterium]